VAAGSFHDTDTANYSAEDFRSTTKGYRPISLAWPARERVRSVVLLGNDTKLRLERRPDGLRQYRVCRLWRRTRHARIHGLPGLSRFQGEAAVVIVVRR